MALAALSFQALQAVGLIGGAFYFTGRVTAVLEQLKSLGSDHETRIRRLERADRSN